MAFPSITVAVVPIPMAVISITFAVIPAVAGMTAEMAAATRDG